MFETVLSDMSELCTQSVAEEDEADHRTEPPFRKPQRGRRVPALRGTLINSDAATTTDGIHGVVWGTDYSSCQELDRFIRMSYRSGDLTPVDAFDLFDELLQ
jgi:hypothetical protein